MGHAVRAADWLAARTKGDLATSVAGRERSERIADCGRPAAMFHGGIQWTVSNIPPECVVSRGPRCCRVLSADDILASAQGLVSAAGATTGPSLVPRFVNPSVMQTSRNSAENRRLQAEIPDFR